MPQLTEHDRIEILMMIGYGDRRRSYSEVVALYNAIHEDREPIARSTVIKTLQRFDETGGVKNRQKPGRPKVATSEESSLNVLLDVQENPKCSVQQRALTHHISRRSVQKILKKEKFHPYKIHLLQELSEDDFDRRIEFCETAMNMIDEDRNILNWIMFSDEATFCLNGNVNRHNCRYWSDTNPHWMEQVHTQHPQKVNVWCGIIGEHIIGPFFIDGNLNAVKYLQLLREHIIPELIRLFPNRENAARPSEQIWFQQDGAPPHFAVNVRGYLNAIFPDRWIGRRGAIECPARSPDLTPLDFFLWGYLKNRIYADRPHNAEDLKGRIRAEIQNLPPNMLQRTLENFYSRLHYCQEVNGEHFEHLL